MASAIWVVCRSWTWRRRAVGVDDRGQLRDPVIRPSCSGCRPTALADERDQVVLAQRHEGMSRTIDISSCPAANVTVRNLAGSLPASSKSAVHGRHPARRRLSPSRSVSGRPRWGSATAARRPGLSDRRGPLAQSRTGHSLWLSGQVDPEVRKLGSARRHRGHSPRRNREGSRTRRSAGPGGHAAELPSPASEHPEAGGLARACRLRRYESVSPLSRMSSTMRTWRPVRSMSRSFTMRTTPLSWSRCRTRTRP